MAFTQHIKEDLFPVYKQLDENLVAEYIDSESVNISMNETIDISFIRKWYEKLDWKTLTINFEFSEAELLEFFGSIHWKSAVYTQPACTKKFIKDNNLEYVIDEFESFNTEFTLRNIEEYGKIENLTVISEKNREVVLQILLSRLHGSMNTSPMNEVELLFEDGSIYRLSKDKVPYFIRDLKLETLENNDILDSIRKTTDKFANKI